jgi:hypothetical protein
MTDNRGPMTDDRKEACHGSQIKDIGYQVLAVIGHR